MKKIYNNLSIDNLTKTEWFNQFDEHQQEKIIEGLENNLDVLIYAKPEFNDFQMKQIRLGLEEKLDVSVYAKKEFSWQQMQKIRRRLEKEAREKLRNEQKNI